MTEIRLRKRGRPMGYELSDETKDKIRLSRIGKSHSRETRNKISRSLIRYFRRKDPVSEGIEHEYKYFPDEAKQWICDHKDDIDDTDDILTNKRIIYLSQLEVCYGSDIENFCHFATPEFLVLLKEDLKQWGMLEELKELDSLL